MLRRRVLLLLSVVGSSVILNSADIDGTLPCSMLLLLFFYTPGSTDPWG